MVAIGLLERHGGRYANSPVAAAFLSGATPADLRPLLRFWDRLSYPEVAGLPPGSRVLDIGGGTGSWSIALVASDPALTATVLEIADVARVTRDQLRTTAYADRIDVHVGDVLADDLPRGYDAFLVANLVHYFTPETNRSILHRIRAAAEPGARLLHADFWTDPTHTHPHPAALMAGDFAIHVNDGDVYSVEEGAAWLHGTGWRYLDHRPLAGPMSVIVAETA